MRTKFAACIIAMSFAGALPAVAQQADAVVQRIKATSADMQRYLDLLGSRDRATRIAALTEMSRSNNTALADLAIETGLASDDQAMQAIALRQAFVQVRSIVAKVDTTGAAAGSLPREALQICGDAVKYTIERYRPETGHFEVRGQDHTGVGNISGSTVSLTLEYGCSLSAVLQRDGSFTGTIAAPYRKGALPVQFTLR